MQAVKEEYPPDKWKRLIEQTVVFAEPEDGTPPRISTSVEVKNNGPNYFSMTCLTSGVVRHAILLLCFDPGMCVILCFLFGKRY